MDNGNEKQVFEFGEFRVDGSTRTLLNRGQNVTLTSKVFDTLLFLVTNHGRLVDKDELMREIWFDTIVEENNLNKNISKLRQVLGEKPGEHRFIATVPGKGYKFVAPVTELRPQLSAGATGSKDIATPSAPHALDPDAPIQKRAAGRWVFPLVIASAALLVGFGLYYVRSRPSSAPAQTVSTLAVLPFKPLVAESREEALEMGMADTLIARLSGDRGLIVRPLGSVRKFTDIDQDVQAAGRELGVEWVLDGSIQRSGENIRVNVRLIDVASGSSVWSGTYDEQFTNIFSVQDRITGKVAEALKLRLGGGNDASANQNTRNPEAYRLYLQGRYYSRKITPPDVRRGIEFFQRAIDADPAYALAYAGMADAYRTLPINGDVPSADVMPLAKAAAQKALEIDPQNADAHTVLGWVGFWYDHDWKGAEGEFKRAIELNRNNSDAYLGHSVLLTCLGRHKDAIEQMAKARELDPLSLITGALQGQTFLFAGQYERAIESLNKTFEIDPNFWVGHIQLARVFIQQNDFERAIAEAEKAKQFSGGNSEAISLAGYAHAKAGRPEKARQALALLIAMRTQGRITNYNAAMVYNALGRPDEALAELQQAVDNRDVRLILLRVDPKWDNLRNDQRFILIQERLNFE